MFLLEQLPPWHSNLLSRLIKTPKLHLNDTGLTCALLGHNAGSLAKDRSRLGQLLKTVVYQELRRFRKPFFCRSNLLAVGGAMTPGTPSPTASRDLWRHRRAWLVGLCQGIWAGGSDRRPISLIIMLTGVRTHAEKNETGRPHLCRKRSFP